MVARGGACPSEFIDTGCVTGEPDVYGTSYPSCQFNGAYRRLGLNWYRGHGQMLRDLEQYILQIHPSGFSSVGSLGGKRLGDPACCKESDNRLLCSSDVINGLKNDVRPNSEGMQASDQDLGSFAKVFRTSRDQLAQDQVALQEVGSKMEQLQNKNGFVRFISGQNRDLQNLQSSKSYLEKEIADLKVQLAGCLSTPSTGRSLQGLRRQPRRAPYSCDLQKTRRLWELQRRLEGLTKSRRLNQQ